MSDNDNLSKIPPVEFKWDDTDTTIGVIAQNVGSIDINSYSMTSSGVGAGLTVGHATVTSNNSWANGSSISFANSGTLHADTTEYGKTTIKTAKSTIDIDELADMMETLKKRLLILTPTFEKHEKYPMLKELYNEYRAMERLLSGPDSDE